MIVPQDWWDEGANGLGLDMKPYFSGSYQPPFLANFYVSRDYFFPSVLAINVGNQDGSAPKLTVKVDRSSFNPMPKNSAPLKAVSKQMVWHISDNTDPFFGDISTDAGIRKFEKRDSFGTPIDSYENRIRNHESTVALPIVYIRGGSAERTSKAFWP